MFPCSSMVASVISGSVRFSSTVMWAYVWESLLPSLSRSSIFTFSLDIRLCVFPEANSTSTSSKSLIVKPRVDAVSGSTATTGSSLSASLLTNTMTSLDFPVCSRVILF